MGEPRILITGATGFLGRSLRRRLVSRRCRVSVLSRRPGTDTIELKQSSPEGLRSALSGRGFDIVFHLAAAGTRQERLDPRVALNVNVGMTHELVCLAAEWGAKAVIVAGSSAEYAAGSAGETVTESAPLEDRQLYGASKAAGGLLSIATAESLGLPLVVLRVFGAYGPGEADGRLLHSLIRELGAGRPVSLSEGSQQRDFVFVDDVVDAFLQANDALYTNRLRPGAYNVCTGQPTSVREFARIVADLMDRPVDLLEFGSRPLHRTDRPFVVGCPDLLEAAIGWRAVTGVCEGIRQTLHARTDEPEQGHGG